MRAELNKVLIILGLVLSRYLDNEESVKDFELLCIAGIRNMYLKSNVIHIKSWTYFFIYRNCE